MDNNFELCAYRLNSAKDLFEVDKNIHGIVISKSIWTTDSSLEIVRSKKVEQIKTDIISGRHNFYQNLLNAAKDEPFTRKDTPDEQQRIFKSYSNVLLSHFADERSSLLRNEFQRKKPQGVIEILNYEKSLEVPADIISRFPGIKVSYQDQLWKANPRKLKKMDIPTYDSCLSLLECLCDLYHWETEETGSRHPLLPHGNRNCLRLYLLIQPHIPLLKHASSTFSFHNSPLFLIQSKLIATFM